MRLRGRHSVCLSGYDPVGPWSSPAVVGATVPIAVLAVPVGVLAVHWGWAPWRLGAPDTVLVLSLDVGESLSVRGVGEGVRRLAIDLSRIHIPAGACVSESHRLFILNNSISAAQEPQYLANTLTAATRLTLKLTSAISRPCVSYIVYLIKI